jgi:hypothetical protein
MSLVVDEERLINTLYEYKLDPKTKTKDLLLLYRPENIVKSFMDYQIIGIPLKYILLSVIILTVSSSMGYKLLKFRN